MTWMNAFDVGPCTVSVDNASNPGNDYFAGVLGKGQSSPVFQGFLSGENLQVTVNSDGSVALNFISGSGPAVGYVLIVIPSYSVDGLDMRSSGFNMPNGVTPSAGTWATADGDDKVALTGSGSAWSPDPADIGGNDTQQGWTVFEGAAF